MAFFTSFARFFASLGALLVGLSCGAAESAPTWWLNLSVRTMDGRAVGAPTRWTVVVFLDPECPIANSYVPVVNALAVEFGPKGVGFLGAYTDPTGSLEKFRAHARDYALKFTAVDDRAQRLARFAGASYSAEAVVLDARGAILYRGRIDDRVGTDGAVRPAATSHDLRRVITRLFAGEAGPFPGERGFGCSLATGR